MRKYTKQLLKISSKIRLLATDIDGVLTAGEVILLENGEDVSENELCLFDEIQT